MLFRLPEGVRAIAENALERDLPLAELASAKEFVHLRLGDRHDLRPDETGRFRRFRRDMLIPALHPLVVAVALVLRRLEKRVNTQRLALAVDGCVELKSSREH